MPKLPKITNFLEFFQYSLLLFVVLIPLADHSRMSILYNKIVPVRILLLFLILAGVYFIFQGITKKTLNFTKAVKELSGDNVFRLLGVLWLIRLVSLMQSGNLGASVELFAFYTAMISLYILMRSILLPSRFFVIKLVRAFVLFGLVVGFYGLFQYVVITFIGHNLPGVLSGGDYIRLPGTFFDANHFAAYLSMIAPMVVAFSWLEKKFWPKAFWWLAYFLISFVILYSFSRSGLLSLIVGSLVILILGIKSGYYRKILPLLGAIAISGLVIFVSNATGRSLLDRVKSVVDLEEPSTKAHYLLLRGEVELFTENPIFGIGYGSFSEKFRQSETGMEHSRVDPADVRIPAHSVWFEIITETGLVGLSVYLAFVILILKSLIKLIRHSHNKTVKIYSIGFLSGLIGIWTGGIFYSYNLEFFWFYIFLALLFTMVFERLMKEGVVLADGEKKETLNWYEIIPAVSVLLSAIFVIFYRLGSTNVISSEAVLATVAREMYRNTNWLVPTYQGATYLSYPPLFYWLSTNIIHLYLSVPNLIIRFLPALFGVGAIFLTYLIARQLINRYWATVTALLSLFITPFVYLTRSVNTEIMAAFFILLSIYTLQLSKKHRHLFLLSGVSLGLASLTDGLLTILFLPIYLLLLLNWNRTLLKKGLLINVNLTVFLLIFLPWHLYSVIYDPVIFMQNYFRHLPNIFALTPLLSLLIVYLTYKYYQKHSLNHLRVGKLVKYAILVILIISLPLYINLPSVTTKITPPNANQDLADLILSPEYQGRSQNLLLLNGVSTKVAGYYTEGKYQEVDNYDIEKTITSEKLQLLITSADRGEVLLQKFARDERGLRLLKRAGMLVLLANY